MTILTFEIENSSNNSPIPQDYGDNVSQLEIGAFRYGSLGGLTPNVEIDYNGNIVFFEMRGQSLDIIVSRSSITEIILSAEPGYLVSLEGFDLVSNSVLDDNDIRVLTNTFVTEENIIFEDLDVEIDQLARYNSEVLGYLESEQLVLRIDEPRSTASGVALDNIIFSQRLNPFIEGTNNSDRLTGDSQNNQIYGRAGNDTLEGFFGNDTLDGGSGDDLLFGGRSDDLLIGNRGNDTLDGGRGDDTMRGSDGNDYYILDSVDDVVENEKPDAEGGIDTIESSVDFALGPKGRNIENLTLVSDRFTAGIGNVLDNQIIGSDAKNRLSGGSGDDYLDGGRQEDRLLGNPGNDILIGNFADDLLEGGLGRDRFQFDRIDERLGVDTIVDFNPAADFIVLNQRNFDGINEVGAIDDDQLFIVDDLDDVGDDFIRGFVYATNDGSLAYIDSENDIDLTQFALLSNLPDIEADNIRFF